MKLLTILLILAFIFVLARKEEVNKHTTTEELGKGIHYHEEEPSGRVTNKDLFWSNEKYNEILSKLGLDKKETLTRDNISQLVSSLIGLGECECDMTSFEDFFKSYTKNLPDSIKLEDLKNRITSSDFLQSLKDYFKDKPEILNKLNTKYTSYLDMINSIHEIFNSKQHSSFWQSDLFTNIDDKLGLSKKTTLTRDDVINFLTVLIGEDVVKGEYKDKFNMVFDAFVKNLPDSITLEDLKMKCFHMNFIGPLLKAFVGEPTIWEKLKYSFKNNLNDFSTGLGSLFKREESYFDSPVFLEILKKLKLENKDDLTKDDIKSLLTYIVGEDIVKGKYSDIFNAIFDSYTQDLPERIKMSDLKVFLYQHDLPRVVLQFFVKEPTMMEKLKYNVGVTWMDMSKYFRHAFGMEKSFWESPEFKAVVKKMGWQEDKMLRKDDIKQLLRHLIGNENISEQNMSFFDNTFDMFLKDFPDEIKISDLANYMDQNKFMQSVRSYFHKEPTTYEKVKSFFWNNIGQYFSKLFNKNEENFWTSSIYHKISSTLNFQNKEFFNREDLFNFLNTLLEVKIPDKFKNDLNDIYRSYLENLPERIKVTELGNYLDINKFTLAIRDFFTIKYPEEMKDKFTNISSSTWFNITDYFDEIFQTRKPFWNESSLKKILTELGFNRKTNLNREEMYLLVKKLIFGKETSLPNIIDDVLRAYIRQLPDIIPVQNIPDYMDYDKFINAVKEVASKKYGKSNMLKFQPLLDSTKMNLSDVFFQVFNFTLKHEEL